MKTLAIATLALAAFAACAGAAAADAPTRTPAHQVDISVKALVDGQARVLSRTVAFCTARHLPQGQSLDASFKTFNDAFAAGTKAGMTEAARTDKDILRPAPVYQAKDFEMMDKQGDQLLQGVQSQPEAGCGKLGALFASGTAESFRQSTIQAHHEYEVKRASYCAKVPTPKNCD